MARIDPVDYSGAERRRRELLDAVNGLLGATPNMTTTMARSAVLDGWLGLSGAPTASRRTVTSAPTWPSSTATSSSRPAASSRQTPHSDIHAAREAGLTDAEESQWRNRDEFLHGRDAGINDYPIAALERRIALP